MRDLAARTHINRGDLSKIEAGRMVPTGDEFERVMTALEEVAAEQGQLATVAPDEAG